MVEGAFSYQVKQEFFSSSVTCIHLQSELVEEVVDEVFDEVDNADIQMLPCDVVEDDPGSRR